MRMPAAMAPLAKLQLADVALRQYHGRCQFPRAGAGSESPGRLNAPKFQSRRHGIHQSASAQTLGRNIAQDAAVDRLFFHFHLGNRAGRGAHAHRYPRSLEGRPGRRRGAQQALAIANHDFSVRAQIHQPVQFPAFTGGLWPKSRPEYRCPRIPPGKGESAPAQGRRASTPAPGARKV